MLSGTIEWGYFGAYVDSLVGKIRCANNRGHVERSRLVLYEKRELHFCNSLFLWCHQES